jgi:hypothetical protein
LDNDNRGKTGVVVRFPPHSKPEAVPTDEIIFKHSVKSGI